MALFHEVDIRHLIAAEVEELQTGRESKEGQLVSAAVQFNERIHMLKIQAFDVVA
jgi:hypothetical protein